MRPSVTQKTSTTMPAPGVEVLPSASCAEAFAPVFQVKGVVVDGDRVLRERTGAAVRVADSRRHRGDEQAHRGDHEASLLFRLMVCFSSFGVSVRPRCGSGPPTGCPHRGDEAPNAICEENTYGLTQKCRVRGVRRLEN